MADQLRINLDRVFSARYVRSGSNGIHVLMYRAAYPVSVLLNNANLSPNQITTASFFCSICAFLALILDSGWAWFCLFWGLTILLDLCDGTVARMANKVSKTAFRYDHMSDLFKVSLIILGVAVRYNELTLWILAFMAAFSFLYGDALNREMGIAVNRQKMKDGDSASSKAETPELRNPVRAWGARHSILRKVYRQFRAVFLTVNGHTLLLFFAFPFGREPAVWIFWYLIFIELLAIRSRISRLVAMRR